MNETAIELRTKSSPGGGLAGTPTTDRTMRHLFTQTTAHTVDYFARWTATLTLIIIIGCGQVTNSQTKENHIDYWPNGKKISEGLLIDKIKEGEWKFYYENGNLQKTVTFVKGQLHGDCWNYAIDKSEKFLDRYANNELVYHAWYRNDTLRIEEFYYKGKITKTTIHKK